MKISITDNYKYARIQTKYLIQRLLSPLCGLNTHINFISRSRSEPKILIAGAELTGVHILQGLTEKHRPGSHHIGGSGSYLNEVLIKIAGETIERYSQLISEKNNRYPMLFTSYEEMLKRNEKIISAEKLKFFTQDQRVKLHFPFQEFSVSDPISWVQGISLIDHHRIWVPAQLVFVGYSVKRELGEPWIFSAVTTGTASHTRYPDALRNALLELIQLDSAMGHWYTETPAMAIEFDETVTSIANYIKYTLPDQSPSPRFFWIKNVDLATFTVACVFESSNFPRLAVGLGSDTHLSKAIQKAYLEAIGVNSLAKLVMINEGMNSEIDENNPIYNLDTNVGLYAKGFNSQLFNLKFNSTNSISAREILNETDVAKYDNVSSLVNRFVSTNKELIYFDLTTSEAKQLGFVVSRVWSPDTLSLCLPSAVPKAHSRFIAYGGIAHDSPHPYP